MLSENSQAVLEKRKGMTQGIPRQLCRPQEDLMNALLELPAFNISIQAPYFSGISRMQTCVEWRTWPGVWERQMGWKCTSQSSHPRRSQLYSLHLLRPRWAFPGATSWTWSLLIQGKPGGKRLSCRTSSTAAHVIPTCYSLTCWFGNSCSQVILGLTALGFPPCIYKWPACSFCCCSYNDLGKSVILQRFWWLEVGKWCPDNDFTWERWYFEI